MSEEYEWGPDKLNPKILWRLQKETDFGKQVIRNGLYTLRKRYKRITMNAAAQIFAEKRGFSVLRYLTYEDKKTIPSETFSMNNKAEKLKESSQENVFQKTISKRGFTKKEKRNLSDIGVIVAVVLALLTSINNTLSRFWSAWPDWSWVTDVIFIISVIFVAIMYLRRSDGKKKRDH